MQAFLFQGHVVDLDEIKVGGGMSGKHTQMLALKKHSECREIRFHLFSNEYYLL